MENNFHNFRKHRKIGKYWMKFIKEYLPYDEQEQRDQEIMLKCLNSFEDILTRENEIAHMTSSAFVVNKNRDKVLMVYHNIFDSWSWVGGHADGEEDLLWVAVKETREETGLKKLFSIDEKIWSLDILPVFGHRKRGKYVPPHLHLSVAYLLEGDEKESLVVKPDENSGVQWIPMDKIDQYSNEPHMKKIYHKIIEKLEHKIDKSKRGQGNGTSFTV